MAADLPVLVYDGECGFCSSSARWIAARWNRPARLCAYQELGDDGLSALGLDRAEAAAAAWWVDDAGRGFRGHLAVAHALMWSDGWRRLGGRLLATRVMWLPAVLGYRLVSRYRRLLPGAAACPAGTVH